MPSSNRAAKKAMPDPAVSRSLDLLNGAAANLRLLAGDEMMSAALVIARERLGLTPEKLAMMLVRLLNPDEVLLAYEEQHVRGVSKNTLGDMKTRGEIPKICGGIK